MIEQNGHIQLVWGESHADECEIQLIFEILKAKIDARQNPIEWKHLYMCSQ